MKAVLFSLGRNKAPNLDRFPIEFFTTSWEVVGKHVTTVVLDFFKHGKLLNEVSNTIIALALKTLNSFLLDGLQAHLML